MRLAIKEAKKALELGEVPVGAVIADKDENLISAGFNLRETRTDATACKNLKSWRLNDLTLYVTLEPCPMCAGALVNSRIRRLVYGVADSKAGAAESLFNITSNPNLQHRLEIRAGVLEFECKDLLQKFFQDRR